MRRPFIAMDINAVREAARNGHTAEILAQWREAGVVFDSRLGAIALLNRSAEETRVRLDESGAIIACDAQPELVTQPNAGIPAYLTNYIDPKVVEVAVSPMKATQIVGSEEKKGSWETTHATFLSVELTGETAGYGDFNTNGSSGANLNFPVRQSFLYQTFTLWGELQMARAGAARVDWASRVNEASILVLNKYQNATYFFGVSGIPNYGLLNDPNLYASIVATSAWNAAGTTADVVYEDIRRLFVQLQWQSGGVIENDQPMTLAMSNTLMTALAKTNGFGINVKALLALNFPALEVKTAVEYETNSGQLVQLICKAVQGQQTATTGYTEKMRAHAVVVGASSWSQKKSQGTFGTIIYQPFAIASLIGA